MDNKNAFQQAVRFITLESLGRPAPVPERLQGCLGEISDSGLSPLLHEILTRRGLAAQLTPEEFSRLDNSRKQTLARQLIFESTFHEIQSIAARSGITILPLKGIHLCETAYPAPGTREMSDIDILVPLDHFEPAQQLLRSQGYTTKLDFISARGGRLPSGACFSGGPAGLSIDLHHSLVNTCGIKSLILPRRSAQLLDLEAVSSSAATPARPAISPPYFLASLILHHYTHNFRETSWHLDTALFSATMTPAQWDEFIDTARRFKLTRLAAASFALCAANLSCEPAELFPSTPAALASRHSSPSTLRRGRLNAAQTLMLIPGAAARAAAVARFFFPSTYYLETVSRRPVAPAAYPIELLKFQARAIKR